MNLSIKNRLAWQYLLATAIVIAVVFGLVFVIVQGVVLQKLDQDLAFEAIKHTAEFKIKGDEISFINKGEWEEREHLEVHLHPVFLQVIDTEGRVLEKSPNLKDEKLSSQSAGTYFDAELKGMPIRQFQLPLTHNSVTKGYIIAAMSAEEAYTVIRSLRNVLLIAFPIILIGLFFVSRLLAGRSLVPIQNITETTRNIHRQNLSERVKLPPNRDELYELSSEINELLDRIEQAIARERQFTSDASHELRTPLASLRGTLEILIRKPRTPEQYQEKVGFALSEIDRMTQMVEQLLELARGKSPQSSPGKTESIAGILHGILAQHNLEIVQKNLRIDFSIDPDQDGEVLQPNAHLILENLLNNAIKYSPDRGQISINLKIDNGKPVCTIADEGPGIPASDLEQIFIPFFRSQDSTENKIPGTGLGLSIAQKAANAINAEINLQSEIGKGTKFEVRFG